MADNFLRFVRGTSAAFNKIANKDKDTLYFVSEKEAKTGSLYLGDKLIGGDGLGNNTNINDLKNVSITSPIETGSILVYNSETEKWESKSPSDLAATEYFVMAGATEESDGESGFVPTPEIKDRNLFLRGDGTWAEVPANSEVKSALNTLIGGDENKDKSIAEIALAAVKSVIVPAEAKETLDTLEEIGSWIQSHSDVLSDGDLVTRVSNLEDTINGTKNELGDDVIIGLKPTVSNLSITMGELQTKVTNIENRLTWEEITE